LRHQQVVELPHEDVLAFLPPAPPRDDGLDVLAARVVRVKNQEGTLPSALVVIHPEQGVCQLSSS